MRIPTLRPLAAVAMGLIAGALAGPRHGWAQGCVAARMDAPVIGAGTSAYPKPRTFDVSTSWRYQKSDRHFVGPDYQEHRDEEGSQVINWIHLLDLSVRYNLSQRSSITLSVPYLMAERSSPIRDPNDRSIVVDRSRTHATGLSDITLAYRRWMLNPETHEKGNFSLGIGIKLPTGENAVHDTFKGLNADGTTTFTVRPVDQSIQPGDGGFGFLLDGRAFLRFGAGNVGAYASGTYLFNPDETNDLNRGSSGINEHLSIADQYIARFGLSAKVADTIGLSLGMRLEGVPSEDIIGGSEGFRRPGYAWSVEPQLTWARGNDAVSLGVPIAVYRNRTANLNDKVNRGGQPGDAAFADYLIMASYAHHFD